MLDSLAQGCGRPESTSAPERNLQSQVNLDFKCPVALTYDVSHSTCVETFNKNKNATKLKKF